MDAVALFARIKVKGCETRGDNVQVLHIRFCSHVDDGADSPITIRT